MNRNEERQRYPGAREGLKFRICLAIVCAMALPFGFRSHPNESLLPWRSSARMRMTFARMQAIQGLRSALSALSAIAA